MQDATLQIQILLHEYDTLRNEVISRTGYGFQIAIIGFTVLGLLLAQNASAPQNKNTSQNENTLRKKRGQTALVSRNTPRKKASETAFVGRRFWLVFFLGLSVLSVGTWFNLRDISTTSIRVRELEREINKRAGECLLEWETRYSPAATGWFWWYSGPIPKKDC